MDRVPAAAIVDERRAFADTLTDVGPDAPTLCGTWTAADVAAHVVSLDRFGGLPTFVGRAIVSRGIRLNDAAGRFADTGLKSTRRRGFAWAIEQLRGSPPRLLLRPNVAEVGLFEVFVHHEDVRRASQGAPARHVPDGLVLVVPWLLRYHRGLLPEVRLVVRVGPSEFTSGEGPEVRVQGAADEVVLWLAGRTDGAAVAIDGDADADAVARVRRAGFKI